MKVLERRERRPPREERKVGEPWWRREILAPRESQEWRKGDI